jgi:hypothetical protein
MHCRTIISLAIATTLGIAAVSTDAFAARAVRGGGVYHGPRGGTAVYRGGAYRGVGVGAAAVGAAAVGAAVAAPYYGRPQCGYYPYPPCY